MKWTKKNTWVWFVYKITTNLIPLILYLFFDSSERPYFCCVVEDVKHQRTNAGTSQVLRVRLDYTLWREMFWSSVTVIDGSWDKKWWLTQISPKSVDGVWGLMLPWPAEELFPLSRCDRYHHLLSRTILYCTVRRKINGIVRESYDTNTRQE